MRMFCLMMAAGYCIVVQSTQAESITIELPKDYGKNWQIRIDGKKVPGTQVLDELIKVKEAKGGTVSVRVLLPASVTLAGWSNIQVIIDKVSFPDAQYFALSDDQQKMVEIKRIGSAIPASSGP